MSAAEKSEEDEVENSLIIRLGGIAVKARSDATLFHQNFFKTKTERTPISTRFAFYGEVESIQYEKIEDGRISLNIILKKKTAD